MKFRVRPSKPASAVGMVIGLVFIAIGIGFSIHTFSQPVPWFAKAFCVLWTLLAAAITAYHALNLFSRRGIAHEIVDTDESGSSLRLTEQRLADLSSLRAKQLITEEEYQKRRTAILDDV